MGGSWLRATGWALCASTEVRGTEPSCPCASTHRHPTLHPQPPPRALDPALILSSATLQAPPLVTPVLHSLPDPMSPSFPSQRMHPQTQQGLQIPLEPSMGCRVTALQLLLKKEAGSQVGSISGFNKYIRTPVHGHHKLRDEPGQAGGGTGRWGLEGFYTMYKAGTMPTAPTGQGGSKLEGSGCFHQPSHCPGA